MNASRWNPTIARPLRCLHWLASTRLEGGGVQRAVLDWCRLLPRYGVDVTLVTADAADVPGEWPRIGRRGSPAPEGGPAGTGPSPLPRVLDLGPDALSHGLLRRNALAAITQSFKPLDAPGTAADVVHLHGLWSPANLQVARRACRAGVPYVVTTHGMLDDWSVRQKWLKKRLFHETFGRHHLLTAAAVHVTAEEEATQVRRRLGASVVLTMLPYVFDLDLHASDAPDVTHAPASARGEVPVLLFLSRIHPKKGLELLFDAAALLVRRGVSFRVDVAGGGDEAYVKTLRDRVARHGLSERVRWLGHLNGEAKRMAYRSSDLFVLPTSQENFGLVFVEAMALGLPVVTTRHTDIWRDLVDGGATIVERTPAAFADAIETRLKDPQALHARGACGRRWVRQTLSPDAVVPRYVRWYCDIAGSAAFRPGSPPAATVPGVR